MIAKSLWVLIIITINHNNGVNVTNQEFKTKENCITAGDTFMKTDTTNHGYVKANYICVEK